MQARLARRLERPALPNRSAILLTASILACVPGSAPAEAQPWTAVVWKTVRNVGAGVSLSRVRPVDSKIDPVTTVGASVGFFPQAGWGFTLGFGWFEADVSANGVKIGRVKVRPLLGGAGYTWIRDRLALKASMAAGIIFNHASIDRALLDRISGPVSLDVRNSFGARLTAGAEYTLARKLGLRGSVNYTATRPSFVATSAQGERRGTWNASNVSLTTTVVVYPLR